MLNHFLPVGRFSKTNEVQMWQTQRQCFRKKYLFIECWNQLLCGYVSSLTRYYCPPKLRDGNVFHLFVHTVYDVTSCLASYSFEGCDVAYCLVPCSFRQSVSRGRGESVWHLHDVLLTAQWHHKLLALYVLLVYAFVMSYSCIHDVMSYLCVHDIVSYR